MGSAKAHKKGSLVCICLGRIDWNRRIIGYVKNIYASEFKMEILDEFGQKKNTKTFLFNAVKSLEIGGIYNDNLEKLNKGEWVKSTGAPKYASAGKNLNIAFDGMDDGVSFFDKASLTKIRWASNFEKRISFLAEP